MIDYSRKGAFDCAPLLSIYKVSSTIKKMSWSFLFFHFCDANLNALSRGHNLWNRHKKEILNKHFIFHGLRHFNFQPCFSAGFKWMQRISTDDFDALTQDFLKPRLFNRGFSLHYIFHLFFFYIFSSIVCRHFFVVRPEMCSNSFFHIILFLCFFYAPTFVLWMADEAV